MTATETSSASSTAATTTFDPLASTPGLQLSIPSSEAGTAWSSSSPNDNTITASFDASSPGYLVGGGSGDSGVTVCAGRGLALVAAGGAVSVFTADGVRKAGPTPLAAFFRGVEKPAAAAVSSSSSKENKPVPTGSWSSARCVYDASSSTPEAERQFYLAALYTPAPAGDTSSSPSQLIVAATAEGDPTKTWAGPFVVNADGLVGQGNGTSVAGTMADAAASQPAPKPLLGLSRCAPAGCVAKDLALGIDAHALWATFDLFTSSTSSDSDSSSSSSNNSANASGDNAAAASRAGASALGLSRAQLRAGAANKRPTTVALSNFPAWTRALTPATTSPRAKHDSRAGGTQYLVAVSGGAGSGAAAGANAAAKTAVASPLVVDDGDASKGTFVAAWSVTGTGTLVDGCKEGVPLTSTETTYVTKSAAPVAAFFGGAGAGGAGGAKKETTGDASKVSSSAAAAFARAPRTLGGAADVSSTRRVGSVTLANSATPGARKLWIALSTPVRVGGHSSSSSEGDEAADESKATETTPPVLGASLLAFEIAPNSVEQASSSSGQQQEQQSERPKPSLVATTTALLALPSASIVAPAAALARGNGTLVGVSFVTVAADMPPSLAYATFTPEAGVSSVRLLSKGVSPLSAFVAPGASFPSSPSSSFASVASSAAPGNPRAAPAPSASSPVLQRFSSPAAAAASDQQSPPLPMPRYGGATVDAEGGWWFAGQVTGCESSASKSGSSVGSAATSSAAKAASVSPLPACKPVTVYTVARVRAVPLE